MATDKERLDWLDNGGRVSKSGDHWKWWATAPGREAIPVQGFDSCRSAIDAAMKSERRDAHKGGE